MKSELKIEEKMPIKLTWIGILNIIICISILFWVINSLEFKKTIKTSFEISTVKNSLDSQNVNSSKTFIAKVKLSKIELTEIKKGQEVIVKLDEFPYQEFGVLRGEIFDNEFKYSNESLLKIILKQGYISSYSKGLIIDSLSKGQAEIIVSNVNIIHNIWKN